MRSHHPDSHRPGARDGFRQHDRRGDGERRFARRDDWLGDDGERRGRGLRHDHGGHGRGGRGARGLEHGDLRLVVLDLIGGKPRHGYEIIKAIEEATGGAYSPSPGVIYPTLTLLAELGHASATEADGGRKLYAPTADGRAWLDQNAQALRAAQGRIAEMQARSDGAEPPAALLRAMENLKLALRLRLARSAPTAEQVREIAAAIDAAALAVENI